jgi:hypothetical protein
MKPVPLSEIVSLICPPTIPRLMCTSRDLECLRTLAKASCVIRNMVSSTSGVSAGISLSMTNFDFSPSFGDQAVSQPLKGRRQSKVIEDHWPQILNVGTQVCESRNNQVPQRLQLQLQWLGVITLDGPSLGWTMIAWGIYTLYMAFGSFRISVAHAITFVTLTVLFGLLAAHFFGVALFIAGA